MDLQFQVDELAKRIAAGFASARVPLPPGPPDHLYFRVATMDEYRHWRSVLLTAGELLAETIIRGRPIATFRLAQALRFHRHEISILELPAPKPGAEYPTGFEHVEYVLDEPLESYRDRSPQLRGELRENPFNPELVCDFGDAQVKFHLASLEDVIALEKKSAFAKQLVVFDLDGTLVNSISGIDEVNRRLLEKFGVDPRSLEKVQTFPSSFRELIKNYGLTVEENVFAERWGEAMLERPAPLFPRALELLETLQALGLPMALWTARDERSARALLRHHGLERYFRKAGTHGGAFPKPAVEGMKFLAEGRPADFVVFVGDSELDRRAAKNFGCRFVPAHEAWTNPGDFAKRFLSAPPMLQPATDEG